MRMTCWKMMTSTDFTGTRGNTFDFDHVIRLLYVYCNLIIHCMYIYIYIHIIFILGLLGVSGFSLTN